MHETEVQARLPSALTATRGDKTSEVNRRDCRARAAAIGDAAFRQITLQTYVELNPVHTGGNMAKHCPSSSRQSVAFPRVKCYSISCLLHSRFAAHCSPGQRTRRRSAFAAVKGDKTH